MSKLTVRQRVHNAAGSQDVENCKARHAYYHAKAEAAEEWDNIWAPVDEATWGHWFGRMKGWDSIYNGSVTNYDAAVYLYYLSIYKKYPQIGGRDPRPLSDVSMHILDTDVIEVAGDGETARATYFTPGLLFNNYTPEGLKRCLFMWEHYGSDFLFHEGEWKYLHEQVCPNFNQSLDNDNWAFDTYRQLCEDASINLHAKKADNTASGGEELKPDVEEPLGIVLDYAPNLPITSITPCPEPYETMDDKNSYAAPYSTLLKYGRG